MKKIKKLVLSTLISLFAVFSCCFIINDPTNHLDNVAYGIGAQNSYQPIAKSKLDANTQQLYNYLSPKVIAIADGSLESTKFTINESVLSSWGIKLSWTSTELDISSPTLNDIAHLFYSQFKMESLLTAMFNDFPYEMYWFDKVSGISQQLEGTESTNKVSIQSFIIKFQVCKDYQASSYSAGDPKINTTKASTTGTTLNLARQIVETNKDLSDYQKLLAYKNKICELNTYNESTPSYYGDPWQVIYVFDNNPSTNVVCEGYAKAFQLLCNMTTFNSSKIKCYTITGIMSGGTGYGNHMWNIVTMDDDKNYLVDITNSDTGTVGASGSLFLAGTIGSISSNYSFHLSSTTTFAYSTEAKNLWGSSSESILNITSSNYQINHPVIKVTKQSNIYYSKLEVTAGLNSNSNHLSYSFDGTEFDYNDYTWSHEWYTSLYNNPGVKLSSAPINAGSYFIRVKAIDKSNSNIYYVNNFKFEILPKPITIDSVYASGREYNGTKNISLTVINLDGVKSGDNVYVDNLSTTAEINSANVGTYNTVNLSGIALSGPAKNNYTIQNSISNVLSNNIVITKTTPTCIENFAKITTNGKLLKDLAIEISGKGATNENVEGTFVWTDKDGNLIDTNTEIIKDQKYYYKFTPSNPNYKETIVETTLYPSKNAEEVAKEFFTKENLPTIIVYGLYIFAGITIISCAIIAYRRKHETF